MNDEKLMQYVKGLNRLRTLLTQDENGREIFLYPNLNKGDVWWIPDEITSFSIDKERHPWIIVNGYSNPSTSVILCPRTTSYRTNDNYKGILTPRNIIPGLEKEGLLLLKHRRNFPVAIFQRCEYIGRMPNDILNEIQKFYNGLTTGKIK
jgi:mRNA-degrading endonuclease toxin of MazEF toxin-antitoxin module